MEDSREEVINTTDQNPDKIAKRAALKARMAEVLSRSIVLDRLTIPVPEGIHHEWCPNDEVEIQRKLALGFELNTEYGSSHALHDTATGKIIVGDLVSMIIPKEQKEVIDELVREQFLRDHGPRKKEEKDFKAAKHETGPLLDKSTDKKVNIAEILESLPTKE